jgi:hypothetical protein
MKGDGLSARDVILGRVREALQVPAPPPHGLLGHDLPGHDLPGKPVAHADVVALGELADHRHALAEVVGSVGVSHDDIASTRCVDPVNEGCPVATLRAFRDPAAT